MILSRVPEAQRRMQVDLSISTRSLWLTMPQVTELLSLKQQQASVVQAYEAMKQGEETVRQGKAIMVFTVMTIVFVSAPPVFC